MIDVEDKRVKMDAAAEPLHQDYGPKEIIYKSKTINNIKKID